MARLWEALKPGVGPSAPWSALVAAQSTEAKGPKESLSAKSDAAVPQASQPALATDLDTADSPLALDQHNAAPLDGDLGVPLQAEIPSHAEPSPLWEDSPENSAFVEVGPSDDFSASQGVSLPQFTWKPSLLSPELGLTGTDAAIPAAPTQSPPVAGRTEFPRIARHRPSPPDRAAAAPVQGPIGPDVIQGILERLLQRTALDVHPWLRLSPPPRDGGLSLQKTKEVIQSTIEGLLEHCGEICVLELEGPLDGSSPTMGPGWQEVLLGRVEWEAALREGSKTGLWRFPGGSVDSGAGPWFAARSVNGIAAELRKRFPLVVVSSPLGANPPIGKLWTDQCQGWAWVVATKSWETTGLEQTARAHETHMPPWIGCVLVDG